MIITESAKTEILKKVSIETPFMRVFILGGGCSGFSYNFELSISNSDDIIIDNLILVDSESWLFLENSTLDYINDLTGSYFKVKIPEAKSFCGCGTSFSI